MYWETLNLSGKASSAAVEDAARWVQWAQAGIMDDQKTRYNLGEFWKAKASAYPNETAEGKAQLEKLDVLAHGIWSAIEQKKSVTEAPSFLSSLASTVLGLQVKRPAEADLAAKRAAIAAQGSVAASRRIGGWGSGIGTAATNTASTTKAEGDKAWSGMQSEIMGIPTWAWLVGGGLLAAALLVRR